MKELKEFSLKEEYVPRSILYIVVHCSATRANIPFTEDSGPMPSETWLQMYRVHFYVTKDGALHHTLPKSEIGAHALGFNLHSLSICYEGGLDEWVSRRIPEPLRKKKRSAGYWVS